MDLPCPWTPSLPGEPQVKTLKPYSKQEVFNRELQQFEQENTNDIQSFARYTPGQQKILATWFFHRDIVEVAWDLQRALYQRVLLLQLDLLSVVFRP